MSEIFHMQSLWNPYRILARDLPFSLKTHFHDPIKANDLLTPSAIIYYCQPQHSLVGIYNLEYKQFVQVKKYIYK